MWGRELFILAVKCFSATTLVILFLFFTLLNWVSCESYSSWSVLTRCHSIANELQIFHFNGGPLIILYFGVSYVLVNIYLLKDLLSSCGIFLKA